MLWLCLHFPRLPAEALGLRDPLAVVTESRGAQRWLITSAPEHGITAGTALGTALAVCAELQAHARKPAAERAMLNSLAHLLYRYGSPVAAEIQDLQESGRVPQAYVWVEVGSSLRLFGGFTPLLASVLNDLQELQQTACWAAAPTRRAAALLAACGHAHCIDELKALQPRLARLPITALPWPRSTLDALRGMGLRRLDDLWRLPRSGFAQRFGTERLRALDQLRGAAPDPVQPIVPPPHFRRRFEFADEVSGVEGLLFPLRRLAFELQGWLRARDLGVLSVQLECEHTARQRHLITLRFLSAHREGDRLFTALRERLNREVLPGAVRALSLRARDLATTAAGQSSLFATDAETQLQWNHSVERLMARLGEKAVWTPAVHEDHRPGRSLWRAAPGQALPARHALRRPPWLLPAPQVLPAPPATRSALERIESGWWDGGDIRRDYYRAALAQSEAWVFQSLEDGRWYLHGWWS